MGRRLFLSHLAEARKLNLPHLHSIISPEEGLIDFKFKHDLLDSEASLQILATNIDEYPEENRFMLYTADENIYPSIPHTLQSLSARLNGRQLVEVLEETSKALTDLLNSGPAHCSSFLQDDKDNMIVTTETVDLMETDDTECGDEDEEEDNDAYLDDSVFEGMGFLENKINGNDHSSTEPDSQTVDKLQKDLTAARQAGFRVGIFGSITSDSIICISIRVTKLGLSDEAMRAWGLRRKHYLVLMIRFLCGYRDLNHVKGLRNLDGEIEMRVGLCVRYKPSKEAAYTAFRQSKYTEKNQRLGSDRQAMEPILEPLFIERPLNDLLRESFAKIVKVRDTYGFKWASAEVEVFVNRRNGEAPSSLTTAEIERLKEADAETLPGLVPIVTDDELGESGAQNASLPLVAMQFLLRHFVRCTEFCLVCHCKTEETFEALKPYVCSRPLCLYQYMHYSFGPIIEWELLSQPYVVDLLLSFCYVAARQGKLKEFPVGMDLKVPVLPHFPTMLDSKTTNDIYGNSFANNYRNASPSVSGSSGTSSVSSCIRSVPSCTVLFHPDKNLLKLTPQIGDEEHKPTPGTWLVLFLNHGDNEWNTDIESHFRIEKVNEAEATLQLTKVVMELCLLPGSSRDYQLAGSKIAKQMDGWLETKCYFYNKSFDQLDNLDKCSVIATLLNTLPSVIEMQKYLKDQQKGPISSLKTWNSRISDPALNILQWVVASNRSCILQVDSIHCDQAESIVSRGAEERVSGMDNWIQFRFAQGAPDKEQRFIDVVGQQQRETGKKHPTIFAWHGSPLDNWHSIIREGLRYDYIRNARVYGNGVYMSSNAQVSLGYTTFVPRFYHSTARLWWNSSVLKITAAFSLNEVVNNPSKFVHSNPHYVVDAIDWIQTRYLFVKSALKISNFNVPSVEYEQDPAAKAINERSVPIVIPLTAIPKSRWPTTSRPLPGWPRKRPKCPARMKKGSEVEDTSDAEDASEKSDDDDTKFLLACGASSEPVGDFVPGSLDISGIKFLKEPEQATTCATKALMRCLTEALKSQNSTPLSQLGWYINPDLVTNLYQWIVEFHSFPVGLPLAREMKAAAISSIVVEMRFSVDFPFSPPFVRVVRPRFLPFAQGGGGNVTEGGAICMELLTNSGWSAVNSIESVLLQVRMALCDEERPARLEPSAGVSGLHWASAFNRKPKEYGVQEAIEAYKRACRNHGWTVPPNFDKFVIE